MTDPNVLTDLLTAGGPGVYDCFMTNRSYRHQTNVNDKAVRALEAIDSLTARLVIDPDIPEAVDRASALEFMLDALQGDPIDTAGWWVAVGVEHDRIHGRTCYRRGELPTGFGESRAVALELLAGLVKAARAVPVDLSDPFDVFATDEVGF